MDTLEGNGIVLPFIMTFNSRTYWKLFYIMAKITQKKTNFMFQNSRDINIYVVLSVILGFVEVVIIALTIIAGGRNIFCGDLM